MARLGNCTGLAGRSTDRIKEKCMGRLNGKVAFLSGGGIGRATAERSAQEGAKVVVAEINAELGEAAA